MQNTAVAHGSRLSTSYSESISPRFPSAGLETTHVLYVVPVSWSCPTCGTHDGPVSCSALIEMDAARNCGITVEAGRLCLGDKVANDAGSATKAGSPLVGLRRLIGSFPPHPSRNQDPD